MIGLAWGVDGGRAQTDFLLAATIISYLSGKNVLAILP